MAILSNNTINIFTIPISFSKENSALKLINQKVFNEIIDYRWSSDGEYYTF